MNSLEVLSGSDAAVAAAWVKRAARRAGMGERGAAELAVAASELASNMVRHAGGGSLEVVVTEQFVELRALDRGPGMKRPELLFADRKARGDDLWVPGRTGAGMGEGGAAVCRMCDQVQARQREGGGLEVVARKRIR